MLKAPPIPRYLLIHTIQYEELTGRVDDYGKPTYAANQTIMNVRVDNTSGYMRTGIEQSDSSNTLVFVDSTFSKPFVDFKKESKVTFNGKEMSIQRVVPCYQPGTNDLHHYELELV